MFRRNDIALYLSQHGVILGHGLQTRLAQRFGVSKSTISRDMKEIYARLQPCHSCGQFRREAYIADEY